eukprot:9204492-Alexandrium_andersonii.AAC.1
MQSLSHPASQAGSQPASHHFPQEEQARMDEIERLNGLSEKLEKQHDPACAVNAGVAMYDCLSGPGSMTTATATR